jgi:hypothetical protein
MLAPYTKRQESMIVSNVLKAVDNPAKLSKQAYKYLYLCSGFIAHYDHEGDSYYNRSGKLKRDLLDNAKINQWRNFTPIDRDYEYYQSKAKIYNRIINAIERA